MIMFWLIWYLPAVISCLLAYVISEKEITVNAIAYALLMGILGWITIVLSVIYLVKNYGDKVLISFKKKS